MGTIDPVAKAKKDLDDAKIAEANAEQKVKNAEKEYSSAQYLTYQAQKKEDAAAKAFEDSEMLTSDTPDDERTYYDQAMVKWDDFMGKNKAKSGASELAISCMSVGLAA